MNEQRLVELEIKVAFQENTISELDQVIADLFNRFTNLQQELEQMKTQLANQVGDAKGANSLSDEKPPHY